MEIRQACPSDMARLDAGLRALAADLGDPYLATPEMLAAACDPDEGFAAALLAHHGPALAGLALVSPIFSTLRGAAGLYVSDLWLAAPARGQGLGRRLLAEAARIGAARWQARFLKLGVYDDNPGAAAFYARLGFTFHPREHTATLDPDAFDALTGARP
ncbi:Acetyltransferase (GNAT) family protein [Rhodovulum sp. ES.010]|uniref:GNAT family N-acetyltransferase n=1 Tax=Rhodovulum sp. ES.010 TaxID=1882821 RepID=UPI0009260552|nr:GNAT family N-acetyltransferase [Rhodovulum sp. ES.010]SIO44997.1 Acetyltransferase (GNAT) family protein [Rhodovulum sp. ES.010]